LFAPRILDRFLAERHPGYLITDTAATTRKARRSRRLREIAETSQHFVFEVRQAGPATRPWRAPPPLHCAGRGPQCADARRNDRSASE